MVKQWRNLREENLFKMENEMKAKSSNVKNTFKLTFYL